MKIKLSTKLIFHHLVLMAAVFAISLLFVPKSVLLAFALALGSALIFGFISSREVSRFIFSIQQTVSRQVQNKVEEINQEKNKVTAIVSGMTDGVIACDAEGRIVMLNNSMENIFSVKAADCYGRFLLEAIRNKDLEAIFSEVLTAGKNIQKELSLLLPVQKIFHLNANPLYKDGKIAGAVMVLHDITEIRRLENIRKEFISNVSHELRTPLTSIKGFVETLLNGALEDKANNRRFLEIIDRHVQRLGTLIDDTLDLSALESQQTSLKMETIDLRTLIEETLEGFSPQIEKVKIKCTIEVAKKNLLVNIDRDRVKQVLINLIDNAIKFNKERGTITITAQDLKDEIKVTITDTGQGIPEKHLSRIFERFYRVDKARSRELGGTGLGLSIVKHIIEAHHGQVGVESQEEQGSTFWFTLPNRI